ncbi:MAG: DUF559 domain-containing protein [Fimbriimonadaceae bacterium]|nr:DUF559 domain-containing protein [Fimbriimonadaceae bacterium]
MPRKLKRLVEFARDNRVSATDAERQLWQYLKGKQIGFRFRQQHPLDDDFVVDFFCPEARIAVELDGSVHNGEEASDASRQRKIEELGILVIRFRNEEVYDNVEAVVRKIVEVCESRLGLRSARYLRKEEVPPPPRPSPVEGEGDFTS